MTTRKLICTNTLFLAFLVAIALGFYFNVAVYGQQVPLIAAVVFVLAAIFFVVCGLAVLVWLWQAAFELCGFLNRKFNRL